MHLQKLTQKTALKKGYCVHTDNYKYTPVYGLAFMLKHVLFDVCNSVNGTHLNHNNVLINKENRFRFNSWLIIF